MKEIQYVGSWVTITSDLGVVGTIIPIWFGSIFPMSGVTYHATHQYPNYTPNSDHGSFGVERAYKRHKCVQSSEGCSAMFIPSTSK